MVRRSGSVSESPRAVTDASSTPYQGIAGVNLVLEKDKENAINGKQKDSVREETSEVSGTMKMSVQKPTTKTAPPSELPTQSTPRGRSASRKRSLSGRSSSGKTKRQPCKNFLKGTCTKSPCDYWHPPESQFYQSESGCKFSDKCSCAHRQVEGQPSRKPKKDGDKSGPTLRHLPEDQNHKGPMQKTQWRSRTSCRNLSEGCEISKQSSICNRVAGLGHPMDPVVSV